MKYYKCDQCKKLVEYDPPKIMLSGYYPTNAAGILIPESCREFHFCSHGCFVAYMRWAVTKESPCTPTPPMAKL